MALTVGGRCPHDIAIAVQTLFNEEKKNGSNYETYRTI